MSEKEEFKYRYKALTMEERKEIDSIRRQYVKNPEDDKLSRLRMLDNRVKNTANGMALFFGICGLLVFGLGMAMVLSWSLYAGGSVVAIIGAALCGMAYPIYRRMYEYMKKKYEKEIIRLSEELLNDKE